MVEAFMSIGKVFVSEWWFWSPENHNARFCSATCWLNYRRYTKQKHDDRRGYHWV